MTDDHRERRVADSSKLQDLITDLSKVPPSTRMYHIHDELMHAIDRSLATHDGHRFAEKEIAVIKDVAFAIVYILDPKNRQAKGLLGRGLEEFKAISVFGKITAIAAVLAFLGGAANGAVEFAQKSYELWQRLFRSEVTSVSAPVAPPAAPAPPPAATPSPAPPAPSPKR